MSFLRGGIRYHSNYDYIRRPKIGILFCKSKFRILESALAGINTGGRLGKGKARFLGWFEEAFVRYLPKKGKIIEADCGLGYYVLALKRRGYDIEGVEWSNVAVGLIKKRYPKLNVKVYDVRNLSVKDGYYSIYFFRSSGAFSSQGWRIICGRHTEL